MYAQLAMAGASMLAAHSQKKKALAAAVEDAKLQRAKLQSARLNAAGDLATNAQRAREATQRREIAIEESKITGEANLDAAFAGSGISGTSVSELDSELHAAAAKNKFENKKALDTQLGDMYKNHLQTIAGLDDQAADIGANAPTGGGLMEGIMSGVSGFQQGAALNSATGINDKISSAFSRSKTSGGGGSLNPSLGLGQRLSRNF